MTPFQRIPRLYVQQWQEDRWPIIELAKSKMTGHWPISLSWGDWTACSGGWGGGGTKTLVESFSFSQNMDMSSRTSGSLLEPKQ